jgi:hypothetical protein
VPAVLFSMIPVCRHLRRYVLFGARQKVGVQRPSSGVRKGPPLALRVSMPNTEGQGFEPYKSHRLKKSSRIRQCNSRIPFDHWHFGLAAPCLEDNPIPPDHWVFIVALCDRDVLRPWSFFLWPNLSCDTEAATWPSMRIPELGSPFGHS